MIKQNITLFLFITSALTYIYAQKPVNQFDANGKRHGVWKKNYQKTNQKRYQGTFVHGKEVDTFKYYKLYRSKSILSALKVFNKKDSLAEVTFLASNKKIISKGRMNGKRFIGQWIFYHKNSKAKMIVENYNDNGKLHNERIVYYKNGVVAKRAFYKNGKLDGETKWYSEQNKPIKVSNYREDELSGKYITYDGNGNKTSEGDYINGKKSGVWYYNEDGKKRTVNYNKKKSKTKKQ